MKTNSLSSFLSMLVVQWFVVGAADAKTINVAYPSPSWNTSLPVSVAKEFGLFTAEGLEEFRTKGKFMNNVSFKDGGNQIEFEDEDSAIRALYEKECARQGVRVNMGTR